MKKKGETKHHISYKPELVVKLPSRGSHLIISGIQQMKASEENIEYLENLIKSITFEKWRMEFELQYGKSNTKRENNFNVKTTR